MELLDLPPEIFERIITKYVAKVGLCEAWQHREVCKTFDVYISKEVFGKQPISIYNNRRLNKKLLYNGLSRYLEHRACALYGADDVLPKMIRNVVSKILEVTEEAPEDKRRSYTRNVCEVLVEHAGLTIFHSLISLGSKHLCMISEDDDNAMALSFAMLIGNDNIVDLLLAQEISPWGSFRLLESPLTIASKFCSTELVERILRQPVTMASNPWQPKTIDLAFSAAINAKRPEIALKLMQWQFRNIGRPSNGFCRKWFQAAMLQNKEMFNCILHQGHPGILGTLYQHDYMASLGKHSQRTLPLMLKSGLLDLKGVYKSAHRLNTSRSLLGHAAQSSTYDITALRAILEAGADPNGIRMKNGEYDNPLCDALDGGNLPAVKLLLEYGADPQRARTMAREVLRKSRLSLGSRITLELYQSPSKLAAGELILDATRNKNIQG